MANQLFAEHLLCPCSSNNPVTMLAAQRAPEFEDEIGYLVGDGVHQIDASGFLEVYEWPNMQTPNAGMTVIPGFGAVPFNNFVEALHVLRQQFGSDGSVFDKRQRLRIALDVHHQAQTRLAHRPYLPLFHWLKQQRYCVSCSATLDRGTECFKFRLHFRRVFASHLND